MNKPIILVLFTATLLFLHPHTARAQGLAFAGVQIVVPATGLSVTTSVAVDAAGDIFIADNGNSRVVKVPAGGGPQTTVPASGLNDPYGVAADAAGDVFIADSGNGRLVEVPAGGGAQITLLSGLDYPFGVAVDRAGHVFVTNYNQVVGGFGRGGPQTTVPTSGTVSSAGSGGGQRGRCLHRGLHQRPGGGGALDRNELRRPDHGGQRTVRTDGLWRWMARATSYIADIGNTREWVEVPAGGGPQIAVG